MPIDPSLLTSGSDWKVGGLGPDASVGGAGGPQAPQGAGFGSFLAKQIDGLSSLQDQAAQGAQSLASGTATDPTSVVLGVERARLAMQLAAQIRTKAVEAVNDVFHTQV